ncbi:cobalt ECF transporter T component CbiQ [Ktedonospora formicarum]|uniref:Cobalt ECF transporter T component CbiQ n=1 Tax=Ktedonospora formicarum TaxID=2778364 RepID=A0A8J3HRF9_9CHLR|nr:cobalt ECF transporter T component CbiQ [Ktedonospora formicarum]GHO42497.1 cobalt ECF transporter T component CbiQ [Ktedonospora formicarum]
MLVSTQPPTTRERKRQLGWIEQTISGISSTLERAVFTEEHAHKPGWLQKLDPRAKLGMFLVTVLAASLAHSLVILLAFYLMLLLVARGSQIPFDFFVRRVWMGIPFFAGVVILPSIFLVPFGPRLFDVPLGAWQFGPTPASILSGLVFVARVGVSVSLAILLILTTAWADILKSLQILRVPQVFTLLLSMTYRYIFLFLHTANGMFEARKSRTVGRLSGHGQRKWISASIGVLMHRSFRMSNDVYAAMMARGFKGTIHTHQRYHMHINDWMALSLASGLALLVFFLGGYLI